MSQDESTTSIDTGELDEMYDQDCEIEMADFEEANEDEDFS